LLPLGHTFGKDHQIKFLLSSSNYPKYQSNPHLPNEDGEFFRWSPGDTNTYNYQGQNLTPQNAEITYNFNADYPSYIMLPKLDTSYYVGTKKENQQTSKMNLYPNPAKEEVNVVWNTPIKDKIQIYDLTGTLIRSIPVVEDQLKQKINVQDLRKGIYLVNIPALNLTQKLVLN